jgi:hypothetical protein
MYTKFWQKKLEGQRSLEGPGVGGRIILEWILEK